MTGCTLFRHIPRPDPALIESLRGIPVADLHDEMDPIERKQRLMSPALRPVLPSGQFVGPAVTAFNTPGDNLMMHAALYVAQRGDVLVVSNGGFAQGALWGGNATKQALRIGVAAVVADGPVRDTQQTRELGFPVYATTISVAKPGKEWPGSVNVPILCAGVWVRPGDIIVGDSDSVIVIPPGDAARLAAAARARIGRDAAMQKAIAGGAVLFEEIGGPAALQKLGAAFRDGTWQDAGVR